ncbi:type II toxin-antitoxin system RelE/ParE family toxin [Flexivirga caeni]|uniref:Type II toxin-antitoxin system RelE/ParE family toxin n=1 Tax=Flexivirga caeni TaxID=2294115 RepID=A0A3M9M7Y7_9MICO|nr:type II toxin-antitoxin system RelE/ParE family toxin [Flexivirga caeni]RNI21684.1 type II toxin-antitoxin system RelE/ParE family toxin [Flexivirga caeni]
MTPLPWRDHPAARAELRDAAIWYDDRDTGLGDRLLATARAEVSFIQSWPDAAPLYSGRRRVPVIRRKSVETFPYGIIYFVRDNEVIVVAYAHEKRRPGYWRKRLDDLG